MFKITGMKPDIPNPGKQRVMFDCNWTEKTSWESKATDCKFQVDAHKIVGKNPLTI